MGLGRLLNVFYSMLVESAGGDAEAQAKIDKVLGEGTPTSDAAERRKQAEQNRQSVAALAGLFSG